HPRSQGGDGTVPSCGSGSRSESARFRNAAICPLVTGSSGQNWSLVGGLQPFVIPEAASFSMSPSKTFPSSSWNVPRALGLSLQPMRSGPAASESKWIVFVLGEVASPPWETSNHDDFTFRRRSPDRRNVTLLAESA